MILIYLLIVFSIATIYDFKSRTIPDWLTYPTIILAVLFYIRLSILNNNLDHIRNSCIGLVVFFTIAFLLTKYDLWGGGDTKLLIAAGAVIAPLGFMFSAWFMFWLLMSGVISAAIAKYVLKLKSIPFAQTFLVGLLLTLVSSFIY